jgi:hypothetical protein
VSKSHESSALPPQSSNDQIDVIIRRLKAVLPSLEVGIHHDRRSAAIALAEPRFHGRVYRSGKIVVDRICGIDIDILPALLALIPKKPEPRGS